MRRGARAWPGPARNPARDHHPGIEPRTGKYASPEDFFSRLLENAIYSDATQVVDLLAEHGIVPQALWTYAACGRLDLSPSIPKF
jgi:hypothetical protein